MLKKISLLIAIALLVSSITCIFTASDSKVSAFTASNYKIIKVTDANRDAIFSTPISSTTDETYNPVDRKWNGIPHIEVTAGGRLYASWYTGGSCEPDDNNYMILAYSDDKGKTWVDPFIIVDTDKDEIRAFDPFLHINASGELVWYWWRGNNWSMVIPNPDESPHKITWNTPTITGPENIGAYIQEPVRLSDNSLAVCRQNGYMGKDLDFLVSTDDGKTWKKRGSVISKASQDSSEAQVVELADGTLWMFSRVPGGAEGGIQRWVSYDTGWSWSEPEYNLGAPFIGPGSRFAVRKLASGNIIFVSNNSTSARTNLTVWLSEDDGKTWPYSMLIDSRSSVSYPELDEDSDGNIYLIYDKGRQIEKEIRLSIFTEQDIKDGAITSKNGVSRAVVAKDNSYSDITWADTGVSGNIIELPVGTTKEQVLAMLKTTVSLVNEKGEEASVTGTWKVIGYQADQVGVYEFYFKYSIHDLPEKTNDNRDILRIKVKLVNNNSSNNPNENGCKSFMNVIYGGIAVIVIAVGVTVFLILRKRKTLTK